MTPERSTTDGSPAAGIGFRPDIQGLRALAVGLVVVNHLFDGFLTGGFIGVDVFLVVSGYLITALMLREIDTTGTLSLRSFYARRARRILPAATVVIVVTVIAAVLTLALLRTRTVVEDAIWSTFFLGNVRMATVGTDYFADDAPPSPFRHYWSLAVEEQFYLVWPLVLLLCVWAAARLVRRRAAERGDQQTGEQPALAALTRGASRNAAARVLGVAVLVSLAWSVLATTNSPETAYFSTFTRAFELGIGALLAFLPVSLGLTRRARELLAWGGLLLILTAAVFFDAETAFPGVAALVPVVGAAAILLAGVQAQDASGTRLLGVRPARALGDWSYSLYLWHWPVIVLVAANLDKDQFTVGVKLALLVGVLVLSWASYHLIENPFRRAKPFRSIRGGLLVYPVSVATAVTVAVVSLQVVDHQLENPGGGDPVTVADQPQVARDSGQDDLVELVRASVLEADEGRGITGDLTPRLTDLETSLADLGGCDYTTGTRELCPMGDVDSDRDLVVFGDSLARAMSPAAVRLGEEQGFRVHVLGFAGCPASVLVQPADGTRKRWAECEDFKKWALRTISDLEPEFVLVATSANRVLHPRTGDLVKESDPSFERLIKRGWRDLFRDLRDRARTVTAFANTPRLPVAPAECLTDGSPSLADCTFGTEKKAATQARALMEAARAARVGVVDASKWFCADDKCPMVVGRHVTLRDTHHMTPQYAQELARPLAEDLGIVGPGASTTQSQGGASDS